MNASEPLRRQAAATPEAAAYMGSTGLATTYAAMERDVDAVAFRLHALRLSPGTTAAVASGDLYRYLVTALALARLGVTHAPDTLPAHLSDVALVDRNANGNGSARAIGFHEFWPEAGCDARDAAPFPLHAGGAATFMHCPCSGTTGTPKFVPVSHDLAQRRARGRLAGMGSLAARPPSGMRQACVIAPWSSYGFSSHLFMLSQGGTVLEPEPDVRGMADWIARSQVEYLIVSPFVLRQIAFNLPPRRAPNALVAIEVGGGGLAPEVYEAARQRLCERIVINYGMTECGRVAGMPADVAQRRPGAAGFAYSGVTIEIVDDDDCPVDAGAEGIIRIRSDRSASGYLDDDVASARAFRGGWVYAGDRGVLDPDGLLRVTGRTDDLINRGGVKIDPHVVEAAMMLLATLREVAVFGVTNDAGFVDVCAAIVPADPIDTAAFHARCRERLGVHAPSFVMQVGELPRNASGKVSRNDLARIAVESIRAHRAPERAT